MPFLLAHSPLVKTSHMISTEWPGKWGHRSGMQGLCVVCPGVSDTACVLQEVRGALQQGMCPEPGASSHVVNPPPTPRKECVSPVATLHNVGRGYTRTMKHLQSPEALLSGEVKPSLDVVFSGFRNLL